MGKEHLLPEQPLEEHPLAPLVGIYDLPILMDVVADFWRESLDRADFDTFIKCSDLIVWMKQVEAVGLEFEDGGVEPAEILNQEFDEGVAQRMLTRLDALLIRKSPGLKAEQVEEMQQDVMWGVEPEEREIEVEPDWWKQNGYGRTPLWEFGSRMDDEFYQSAGWSTKRRSKRQVKSRRKINNRVGLSAGVEDAVANDDLVKMMLKEAARVPIVEDVLDQRLLGIAIMVGREAEREMVARGGQVPEFEDWQVNEVFRLDQSERGGLMFEEWQAWFEATHVSASVSKEDEAIELVREWGLVDSGVEMEELHELVLMGRRAASHLGRANMRLVVSVAKKELGRGLGMAELISHGNKGLVKAVEKFDWTRGALFSTYATWWIRQTVSRGVKDTSRTIRIPIHVQEKMRKVWKAAYVVVDELESLGESRHATPEEIVVEMGTLGREVSLYIKECWELGRPVSEEIESKLDEEAGKVEEMMKYYWRPVSLESPVGEDQDSEFGDFVEDEDSMGPEEWTDQVLLAELVEEMLDDWAIDDRYKVIIRKRFGMETGKGETLQGIANSLGLSRERVRQLEAGIKRLLTAIAKDYNAREFWEGEEEALVNALKSEERVEVMKRSVGNRLVDARAASDEELLLDAAEEMGLGEDMVRFMRWFELRKFWKELTPGVHVVAMKNLKRFINPRKDEADVWLEKCRRRLGAEVIFGVDIGKLNEHDSVWVSLIDAMEILSQAKKRFGSIYAPDIMIGGEGFE